MSNPFMKCGHTALGRDKENNPVCPICVGLHPGAGIIDDDLPDLATRMCKCGSCTKEKPSDFGLPFFAYHSGKEKDSYYCGCRGWD